MQRNKGSNKRNEAVQNVDKTPSRQRQSMNSTGKKQCVRCDVGAVPQTNIQ